MAKRTTPQWLKELRAKKWPKVISTEVDPKIAQAAANVGYVATAATVASSLPPVAAETYCALSMLAGVGWVYLNRIGFSRRRVYADKKKDGHYRWFENKVGKRIHKWVRHQPKTRRAGMAKTMALVTALGLSGFSITGQTKSAYYEIKGTITRVMGYLGLNPTREARIQSMIDFQLDRKIPQRCFKRVLQYDKTIEKASDDHDVDYEVLAAVLTVESCGRTKVKSHAGAGGIAQFMPGTARGFCKMKVGGGIDQRNNPYKSIACAAKYLRHLQNKFDDWDTAIGAYNGGPGNMKKWTKRSGGSYWDVPRRGTGENYNYVPKVRATERILESPGSFGVKVQK